MKTLLTTLICFLTALTSSSLASGYKLVENQERSISWYQICSEVAYELNSAVINGQIRSSQAEAVIGRCFEGFVDEP